MKYCFHNVIIVRLVIAFDQFIYSTFFQFGLYTFSFGLHILAGLQA